MGGGGGNEIKNVLQVFNMANPGDIPANQLRKMVHEESTGKEVANYIDLAHVSTFNYYSLFLFVIWSYLYRISI